jgi:hypothetical protein
MMKSALLIHGRRAAQATLVFLAIAGMVMASFGAWPQPAAAQATVINCDRILSVTTWSRQLSAVNTNEVLCYQYSGAAIAGEMQRVNGTALVELQVTRGAFDVFVFLAPAATTNLAEQLNDEPITAGGGWRGFAFANVSPSNNYVVAVAPATEARGNFRLRVRVAQGAQPTAQPVGPVNIFPTTTDAPCSRYAFGLAALCIDPYPVAFNGSISVLWRINDFRYGELDQGDGQGFRGPIAREQRVVVPNITTPRVIRLRWVDTAGRQFVDSILAQVGQPIATVAPTANPNFFPCSRAGIGISNLCVEQPFPVRRGASASVVWRIADFRYGEFDRGDGQGFRGPILREQRVEVPNVTGPRLIRLRWVDSSNQWREDSFVIQVADSPTPIP